VGVVKCYVRREGRIKGDSRGIRSRRTSPNDRIPDIDEMKRTETNVLEFAMTSAARYREDRAKPQQTISIISDVIRSECYRIK